MPQNPPLQGPWKESGVFSPVVVAAPLVSFAVAIPLAALYALINIHVPIFGVITLFALAAFAGGAGFAGGLVMGKGRSRNTKVTTALSVVGGVASLYLLWVFFLFFLLRNNDQDPSLLAVALSPDASWDLMKSVAESGWFTVKGSTPSGILLWVLWGGEAVVFLGVFWFASSAAAAVVWCEACGVDMGERVLLEVAPGTALADVVKRGSASGLDGVAPFEGMALERLKAHTCSTCKYSVAAVDQVTKSVGKKGEITEATKVLLPKFVVSHAFVERALARATPAAPTPT